MEIAQVSAPTAFFPGLLGVESSYSSPIIPRRVYELWPSTRRSRSVTGLIRVAAICHAIKDQEKLTPLFKPD
jgi:hypothetical protein